MSEIAERRLLDGTEQAFHKSPGQRLFEACMAERLLNDIRGWDRRETRETFKGDEWVGFVAGLSPEEKRKWERAAERLAQSPPLCLANKGAAIAYTVAN